MLALKTTSFLATEIKNELQMSNFNFYKDSFIWKYPRLPSQATNWWVS